MKGQLQQENHEQFLCVYPIEISFTLKPNCIRIIKKFEGLQLFEDLTINNEYLNYRMFLKRNELNKGYKRRYQGYITKVLIKLIPKLILRNDSVIFTKATIHFSPLQYLPYDFYQIHLMSMFLYCLRKASKLASHLDIVDNSLHFQIQAQPLQLFQFYFIVYIYFSSLLSHFIINNIQNLEQISIFKICKISYLATSIIKDQVNIWKTLDRENRKPKKWLQNYFVPFIPKWSQRIVDNKKKSIFFLLCLGVFTYYEGFQYLHHKLLYREPFKSKLDRWIFKVKNLPKQSLVEFQPITTLNQNTIEQLKEIYLKYESEMKYGMSRKLMFDVYESLNLFQKDEERIGFYRQSGYYKKRNQKVSSVHFQQFVTIFQDALKKLNKKGNTITESELLSQFIQLCSEKQSEIQKWENKIQQKRAEFVKLLPELQDQKQALIRQMLSENPYVTEDYIQQELENKGLYGLGTKDKLQIYDLQLSLHKVLLDSKKAKLYNSMLFGQSTLSAQKEKKLRDKIMIEEEKVNQLQTKRNEVGEKFKVLFKKQEIFDI